MNNNIYKRKINSKTLRNLIKNHILENTLEICELHIDLEDYITIDVESHSIQFLNCKFTGERLDFICNDISQSSEYQCLQFKRCVIESDIYIKDCKFHTVEFDRTYLYAKHFHITTSQIKNINITESTIDSIILNNLNREDGVLDFRLNNVGDVLMINNCRFKNVLMNMNKINRLSFDKLECDGYFQFWKSQLRGHSYIKKTIFGDYLSKQSHYGSDIDLRDIVFTDNFYLELIPEESKSSILFEKCIFEKGAYFDKSNINKLEMRASFFKDMVSFHGATVNIIKLKNIHFDKIAFFNDFKILLKNSIDIGTIRIIKNQLLKTDNKIDYQTYNVIEQNLLLTDINLNLNDKILLTLNKKSNYFGSSWIKGVRFTISLGLIGFNAMLLANNFINSDYQYIINPLSDLPNASFQEMIREWLKFTFSFDLRADKSYDSNGYLLLIFYFFKIFIGYGVYQTIAAFRKHSNK
ncbi:hypothetical protein CMT57_15075 [Elizabethkingia anophelis]|uniref:hypothetical protein n=1 Tax=Elizabethkingia anophelis TaxID=1117645 RepID=UPI002011E12E|nr:hypothetical protein [Elizabethkingia anophelis]MCL1690019.1 hypothetical protein [Elizabethkingia anophelis]MDV4011143.1 hypothetical protein [Elizabethkingia anophelis]